jgi:hypothetical protein
MKYSRLALLFLLLHISNKAWSEQTAFKCAGSVILLMDSSSAASINILPDAYVKELSPFDLAIRLDKSPVGLTHDDYLMRAASDSRDWPQDEQEQLRKAFGSIDSFAKASGAKLHLPDTVMMIKSTCSAEFGAEGYTRGNRIMLNTSAEPISLHIVAHELWHVISRLNERVRNDAYTVFHFRKCNNIEYKAAMNGRVITNPDCPFIANYVTVKKDGKSWDVAPVLYSKDDYAPGYVMMEHVNIGLLAFTGDDSHKKPLMKDGQPVILELDNTPDFLTQVGANTQYVLHIEEIAAEHFAALVAGKRLHQMEFVTGMREVLMR